MPKVQVATAKPHDRLVLVLRCKIPLIAVLAILLQKICFNTKPRLRWWLSIEYQQTKKLVQHYQHAHERIVDMGTCTKEDKSICAHHHMKGLECDFWMVRLNYMTFGCMKSRNALVCSSPRHDCLWTDSDVHQSVGSRNWDCMHTAACIINLLILEETHLPIKLHIQSPDEVLCY